MAINPDVTNLKQIMYLVSLYVCMVGSVRHSLLAKYEQSLCRNGKLTNANAHFSSLSPSLVTHSP